MVTRRTSERRFFLCPDPVVNQSFWYILGWAASKYNVGIVAACALSNHYHLIIVDRDGCFPDFIRDFNAMLARCLNAYRGRWEAFWTNTQTSMVLLADEDAQVGKTTYALCNPVKDDLVQFAHTWPGATAVTAIREGRTITAARPRHFFRDEARAGVMPEEVTIAFVPPPAFQDRREQFVERLNSSIEAVEGLSEATRAAQGSKVLGRKGVRRQRWGDSPRTRVARRGLNPRVATQDKWARIEAIFRNKHFEARYAEARQRRLEGEMSATFPVGTWLMVRVHGVPVASG